MDFKISENSSNPYSNYLDSTVHQSVIENNQKVDPINLMVSQKILFFSVDKLRRKKNVQPWKEKGTKTRCGYLNLIKHS